jgi:hypothetical protein
MIRVLLALGAVVWLFLLFLFVALARAAAFGDLLVRRASAAQRERHGRLASWPAAALPQAFAPHYRQKREQAGSARGSRTRDWQVTRAQLRRAARLPPWRI